MAVDPQTPTLLAVNTPVIQLVLQGTAIYLLAFLFFRFLLPGEIGSFGIADLLVLVLIAESALGAMSGEFTSLPEGAVLIGVILGWHVLFDWLGFPLRRPDEAEVDRQHSLKGNQS